jgi:Tfp pilus assembly protein PilO
MNTKLVLGIGFVAAAIVALLLFFQANNLKSQLQQSKAELEQLQSQLAQDESQIAQLQPLADKAKQMPIRTKFQKSFVPGYTLQIFNISRTSLRFEVVVTALNKSLAQVIDGGRFWFVRGFASGDQIEIKSDGYNSVKLTVPQ